MELRKRLENYINRAEFIKKHIEKEQEEGKYHEKIEIEDNATGFSYQTVFCRFLDEHVTSVYIEDPYIRSVHQVYNLLRLCELMTQKCPNLRTVTVLTGKDERQEAGRMLQELATSLKKYKVSLNVDYSATLHDREIRLDNGWVIKIGRGLDYFKAPASKFSLGYCDFNLRPCHATTIDIFHSKNVRSFTLP